MPESSRTPDASERITRTLLPDGDIVPGLPAAALQPFGEFTEAREGTPGARVVILMKHLHGTDADNVAMRDPRAFADFLGHQDATYDALCAIGDQMGPGRLRVSLEALTPDSTFPEGYLESIAKVQTRRAAGTFPALESMRQAMAAGGENGESARHHLHGGLRYLAREYVARRMGGIVPGRPSRTIDVRTQLRNQLQALVFASLERGSVDDGQVTTVLDNAAALNAADHTQRHAFVAERLNASVPANGMAVVLYGRDHFADGNTAAPLEDAFPGWRVLVFEPRMLQEAGSHDVPEDAIVLQSTELTAEKVRRAVIDALRDTGEPWATLARQQRPGN